MVVPLDTESFGTVIQIRKCLKIGETESEFGRGGGLRGTPRVEGSKFVKISKKTLHRSVVPTHTVNVSNLALFGSV